MNRTHVMIAGGFAGDYTFVNPLIPNSSPVYYPGTALSNAWLYDGNYWIPVDNMSTVRDRPACSIVQLPQGQVRVLVAGGCQDWCTRSPAISSAEMFDPETRSWSRVADLPKPIMSAKMELFGGLPTIIGGYDNSEQNDVLYQYHPDKDRWIPHPTKLRLARSSPAAMLVPRQMFDDC